MLALNQRITVPSWGDLPLWAALFFVLSVPCAIFAFVVPFFIFKFLLGLLSFLFLLAGLILWVFKKYLLMRNVYIAGLSDKFIKPIGIIDDGISR